MPATAIIRGSSYHRESTFLRDHHQSAMDMDLSCFGSNFLGYQPQSVMNMDADILENLPQMGEDPAI